MLTKEQKDVIIQILEQVSVPVKQATEVINPIIEELKKEE